MCYDLVFWKQPTGAALDPMATYEALMEGTRVDALAHLSIGEILDAIKAEFPGAKVEPNGQGEWLIWDGGGQGMFEMYWSSQHVHACCRAMTGRDMNRIIDQLMPFGCYLFDPQIGERFSPR